VEIAKEGQPLAIFTKDVVEPMLMAAGTPELASAPNTRIVREGDVETDPNKQEAAPPPSLRNPGETLPTDNESTGVMRPVQFPKPHTDETPGANPDEQSSAPPASTPPPSTSASPSQPAQPTSGTQPAPASTTPANATSPDGGKQQPPAPSNQLVSTGEPGAVTN
jgi:hypothetical protein